MGLYFYGIFEYILILYCTCIYAKVIELKNNWVVSPVFKKNFFFSRTFII